MHEGGFVLQGSGVIPRAAEACPERAEEESHGFRIELLCVGPRPPLP